MNDNKLVAVVRTSDKSGTGFHVEQWRGARELRIGLRGGECFFFMNGRVGYRKLCWISCSHLMWYVQGGGVEVGCRVAIALKLSFRLFFNYRALLLCLIFDDQLGVSIISLVFGYLFLIIYFTSFVFFILKKKLGK